MESRPRKPIAHAARGRALRVAALVLGLTLLTAVVAGAAVNDNTLVSATSAGEPADGPSGPGVAVSEDGRYVVFESTADNLSAADDDSVANIYLHDRETGQTELVSRATGPAGAGANADSTNPAISPGGAGYIAFESRATNLSDTDDDAAADVFVRDLEAGTTSLVSRASDGSPANGDSGDPSISAEGAVIAFESRATNLSDLDHDAYTDVFIHTRATGATRLVSRPGSPGPGLPAPNEPANGSSYDPSISYTGTRVAFVSDADNLFADDRDLYSNVYVSIIQPAFTFLSHVSRTSRTGAEDHPANGNSTSPVISASSSEDGKYVAFVSVATNLAGGVGLRQVFRRSLSGNSTDLVSRADGPSGAMGVAAASSPSISTDGRLVAFVTAAANLGEVGVPASDAVRPPLTGSDVFVRDTAWESTYLISRESGAGGGALGGDSAAGTLSGSGTLLAFVSDVKIGEQPPADPELLPLDILQPAVFARELAWRAPPVCPPTICPEDIDNQHGDDHGGDGHTDAHSDGGHAGDAHGAAGHGAGGAHFLLRLGGVAADRMFGTPLHDKFCGGAGNDMISLGGGPDVGYGGACGPVDPPTVTKSAWWRDVDARWRRAGDADAPGKKTPPAGPTDNDRLSGGKGDDALYGGAGNDRLVGGTGRDFLSGGSGRDRLVGGPGRNRFYGGAGNDSINSANGVRDVVDCGFGRDSVTADRRDMLSGCERVKVVRRKSKKDLIEQLPECPGGGHECHNGSDTVVLSKARRAG